VSEQAKTQPSAQPATARQTFEEGMRALESIVSRLEAGNLPLEESLAAFEAGVAVLRALHDQLGEVERRVEILLRDAGGVLRTRDGSELAR
jgi:exodeoxyribonuclease VII small subunit